MKSPVVDVFRICSPPMQTTKLPQTTTTGVGLCLVSWFIFCLFVGRLLGHWLLGRLVGCFVAGWSQAVEDLAPTSVNTSLPASASASRWRRCWCSCNSVRKWAGSARRNMRLYMVRDFCWDFSSWPFEAHCTLAAQVLAFGAWTMLLQLVLDHGRDWLTKRSFTVRAVKHMKTIDAITHHGLCIRRFLLKILQVSTRCWKPLKAHHSWSRSHA